MSVGVESLSKGLFISLSPLGKSRTLFFRCIVRWNTIYTPVHFSDAISYYYLFINLIKLWSYFSLKFYPTPIYRYQFFHLYPSFLILELPQTTFPLSTLTQTLMTLASSASSPDIVNDGDGSGRLIESVITVAVDETTLEF